MLLKDRIKLWRKRFRGRQEVFGTKESFFSRSENKTVTQYTPMYTEPYKTRDSRKKAKGSGITLDQLYVPLGDNHVEGHLKGYLELLVYVLELNGTCKFAALDFDSNHSFEDVMMCYEMIAIAHQLPCYVARSTTKGHHLYLFFNKNIEAKYVTSYVRHVYEELGFMELHRNGVKAIPETFPKTIALKDELSTGYGIKPPMQGKGMSNNMNCWIQAETGKDLPIGGSGNSDEQWAYMNEMEEIKISEFKSLLKRSKIEIEEIRLSEKRGAVLQRDYKRTAPYKPPIDGDLNRIIQGCPAMKRYWEGPEKDFLHHARVALVTWAMQTKNGLELLRDRWKGSPKSEEQISYAIENYQQPWTCKAMQEHGLCVKGRDPKFAGGSADPAGNLLTDHCFRKSPPKEVINGKVEINPKNIPESEWADPSPVRLRVELKRLTAKDLKTEIDKFDKDDPTVGDKITNMYEKMLMLSDKRKRAEVEKYLKAKKLAKVSELKEMEKEAKESRKMETRRQIESSDGTGVLNGVRYTVSDTTGGYAIVDVDSEGNRDDQDVSNFQIELLHDIHIHSLVKEDIHLLKGNIVVGEKKMPFKIDTADWGSNLKLAAAINEYGKLEAVVPNYQLDHFRAAVHLFGRYNLKSEHRYKDYGFDDYEAPSVYRTSKWNISSEGFSGEDDAYVDMSTEGFAEYLGINKISNDQFAKAVNHIKNDLLTFQDPKVVYTAVAHSLQATVQQAFYPFPEAPILWVQGTTGAGKTALAKFVQAFHGVFPRLVSIGGTPKAIEYYSMLFKDALLVLDDYKEAFYQQGTIKLVQTTYERSARARLKPDLDQAQAPFCRGLLMITSEDKPSSEASALSRCLYLEAPQITTATDEESSAKFRNLVSIKELLPGVTGRFIHYVMMSYKDKEHLRKKFYETYDVMIEPVKAHQNSTRIAQNLTANYITWELFCDFMRDSDLLTKAEHSDYIETHWDNISEIRDELVISCGREQASNVFLNAVKEAVMSGRLRIDGMNNNVNENATTVGFVTDPNLFEVYIYPTVAVAEVKKIMTARGAPLSHSLDAIGKQLQQDGYLVRTERGRTQYKKSYRGNRAYVWYIDSKKSGLGPSDPNDGVEKGTTKANVIDMAEFGK